jgi:hypothetical protein
MGFFSFSAGFKISYDRNEYEVDYVNGDHGDEDVEE